MKTILKKLNKFRVIFALIAISLFLSGISIFSGCKRYNDGPMISFRSKTERVTNTWTFQSCTINGANVTAQYAAASLVLTKNNLATFYTTDAAKDTLGGTWEFKHDVNLGDNPYTFSTTKDSMEILVYHGIVDVSMWYYPKEIWYDDPTTGYPPYIAYSYNCKILELKQNHLHLQGTYSHHLPSNVQNDTIASYGVYSDSTTTGTFDFTLVGK
jgi:hypothetical protein